MTTMTMSLHRRLMREEEPEWIVWVLVVVLAAAGLLLRGAVTGQQEVFEGGGVSLGYPATWTRVTGPDQLFGAADTFSSAQFPTGVTVQQVPVGQVGRNLSTMSDIALAWSTRQGGDLLAYRTLGIEPATIDGQQGLLVEAAYVPESTMGSGAGKIPVVARAKNFLFRQGDNLTIITLAAEANNFENANGTWEAILATISLG